MLTPCNTSESDKKDFSKSFMYAIHQVYFLVEKRIDHVLAQKGSLSFSQFMILVGFQCSMNGPVSQSKIAAELHLTEATVSRHISTLVDLGYLTRVEDKENRRRHIIAITPNGRKEFDKTRTTIDHELHEIFDTIKEKDRKSIMDNFKGVLDILLSKK